MSSLLEAALAYAEAGYAVLPLSAGNKTPITKNGVKDATVDPVQITTWWKTWPEANIGIAVGAVSGIIGIDLDYKDGCDPNFLKRIPVTVTTCSPAGGHHPYFRYANGEIKNGLKLETGATIRSDGYYFVVAPSVLSDGTEYKWHGRSLIDGELAEIPEWIEQLAHEKAQEKARFKLKDEIPKGEQHTTLFQQGCSLRAQGFTEEEILAAFVISNGRLQEPAPLENLKALAADICKRYPQGTKPKDEPEPTETEEEKEPPKNEFPVDALGDMMSGVAQVVASKVSAPIEMACSSVLAAAALCVQPFYNLDAFGKVRPISLYFVTIAESGERKSTVDNMVLLEHQLWRKEKEEIYNKEKAQYKEDLENWKNRQFDKKSKDTGPMGMTDKKPTAPKAPVLFVSEPTVEGLFYCLKFHRDSVGLFSDEGGTFLGGHSMRQENVKATLGKLNHLWDGSPIDRIRKGKDDGEIDVLYGKRLSAHLLIQPKLARELFDNEYAKSQGFLARCLTCEPKSKIGERDFLYSFSVPEELTGFRKRVRELLEKTPPEEPQVLVPTDAAIEVLKAFYMEIEPKQKAGAELSSIRDFASKVVEHSVRIAAVLKAFEGSDGLSIDAETMERAIKIGRFYLANQARTTEKTSTFPSKDAEVLHTLIGRKKEWRLRELIAMAPRRMKKKNVILPHINALQKAGFCRFDPETSVVKI